MDNYLWYIKISIEMAFKLQFATAPGEMMSGTNHKPSLILMHYKVKTVKWCSPLNVNRNFLNYQDIWNEKRR